MEIRKFNKDNLKMLRAEIEAALKPVAEQHGIKINLGNISFSASEFRTQLTVSVTEDLNDEKVIERNTRDSKLVGYSDNIVGKKISYRGNPYTVTGINLRKPKFCVVASPDDTPEKEVGFSRGVKVEGVDYKAI
jgi:hypothetical protein